MELFFVACIAFTFVTVAAIGWLSGWLFGLEKAWVKKKMKALYEADSQRQKEQELEKRWAETQRRNRELDERLAALEKKQ